jgi:formylglycine-generating enzyme required for sulfatase activity
MAVLSSPASGQQLKEFTNSIGMKLVLIPAGTFSMGSPVGEDPSRSDDELTHEVTISEPFYLGVVEVTQGQYEKVMGRTPSFFSKQELRTSDSSMYPVERVSWKDAVSFCEKLSEKLDEKAAGRLYRLPTEAEWEYACRAGSNSAFCFGSSPDSLGSYAWFEKNSGSKTHPGGEKKANAWGLYDMHGNVWEWCQDWWGDFPARSVTDPRGPDSGVQRVLRGGGWDDDAGGCRSAYRNRNFPSNRYFSIGFRIAMSPSVKPQAAGHQQ